MMTKTEYFYRTSRGASAMIFLDEKTARNWYENQKKKHGRAMPNMELVKHTITVKEEICEPFECTTYLGRTPEQVPTHAKVACGV